MNGSPPFSRTTATPASAVLYEQVVHLLLRQAVARDPLGAGRRPDELIRDEPVVDEHVAATDELERPDGDETWVARPGADDRDAHPSASATRAWK